MVGAVREMPRALPLIVPPATAPTYWSAHPGNRSLGLRSRLKIGILRGHENIHYAVRRFTFLDVVRAGRSGRRRPRSLSRNLPRDGRDRLFAVDRLLHEQRQG